MIFTANAKFQCQVGQLGTLTGKAGSYLYVGSAFGPGGVEARIKHHLAIAKKPHWHLDYVRPYLQPKEVWISFSPQRLEHLWADDLVNLPGATIPVGGFGASDCQCRSHLFHFGDKPSFTRLKNTLSLLVTNGNSQELDVTRKFL